MTTNEMKIHINRTGHSLSREKWRWYGGILIDGQWYWTKQYKSRIEAKAATLKLAKKKMKEWKY